LPVAKVGRKNVGAAPFAPAGTNLQSECNGKGDGGSG
jgi:hypothetical protein